MLDADLADTATTPAALIERVRACRTIADTAELQILQLAIEWAHAHPVIDEYGLEVTWRLSADPLWHPGKYDAWTYRPLDPVTDPDTYLWTDPHRHHLRQPTTSCRVAITVAPCPPTGSRTPRLDDVVLRGRLVGHRYGPRT